MSTDRASQKDRLNFLPAEFGTGLVPMLACLLLLFASLGTANAALIRYELTTNFVDAEGNAFGGFIEFDALDVTPGNRVGAVEGHNWGGTDGAGIFVRLRKGGGDWFPRSWPSRTAGQE